MATITGALRAVSAQGNSIGSTTATELLMPWEGVHRATSTGAWRDSMALRYSSASQSMLRCR